MTASEKTCQKCYRTFPATTEHFDRAPRNADRLTLWCIGCRESRGLRTPRTAAAPVGTYDRAFGIEIEFEGSAAAVQQALRSAGVRVEVEGYNHRDHRDGLTWKIVGDSTVRGGAELVSPVLQGAAGFAAITTVLNAMSGVAKVNRTCGLHVHMDARRETIDSIKRFAMAYATRQASIDWLVSPSRRYSGGSGNGYCRTWTVSDVRALDGVRDLRTLRTLRSGESHHRYHSVNLCAFSRHGTVEVRQHQGSLNPAKVTAWVRFCMALWTAEATTNSTDTYTMLDELTELDGETREYLRSRAYGFRTATTARA